MDIAKLDPKDIKKAAGVVSEAFFDYPMLVHYFPDISRRKRRLPWYMEKTISCALRYGEVYCAPDMSGVMFILPPGHTRLSNEQYIRGGFLLLPFVMGLHNYFVNDACERFVADTHERLMKNRGHYYLWGVVADPKSQRKGVGTALINVLADRADAENMPVYLETHNESNVAYYERFGFRLAHTAIIPKHGLNFWCMVREPGG